MESGRIKSLDGLRGIFAVCVLSGHFFLVERRPDPTYFQNLALAVQFFFILSGVALCHGMSRHIVSGQFSLRAFARQRLARLYPMHLLSMGIAGIFLPPIFFGAIPTSGNLLKEALANFLLLQAMGPIEGRSWNVVSWSISTEFWVGLIVLPLAMKRLRGPLALALAVACYALIFMVNHTVSLPFERTAPGVTLAALSTGAGLLAGVGTFQLLAAARGCPGRWAPVIEPVLLGLILVIIWRGARGYQEAIALACMPVLIYLNASSATWLTRVLGSRTFTWLGQISFSVYLVHMSVHGALRMAGLDGALPMAATYLIYLISSLGLASILFRYVEAPLYAKLRGPVLIPRDSRVPVAQ
ncbi:acyltransferase family protein [Achromobacter aloeverae]|nr:acyltransferase [Achromobacter aloeverae]